MPNFFIVGAARYGTTSLDRYISQHPEIFITAKKETHFFASEDFPQCEDTYYLARAGGAGLQRIHVYGSGWSIDMRV